jgi:hypothetical protein
VLQERGPRDSRQFRNLTSRTSSKGKLLRHRQFRRKPAARDRFTDSVLKRRDERDVFNDCGTFHAGGYADHFIE